MTMAKAPSEETVTVFSFLCMALLTMAIEVAKNPLWLHDQVGNDLERS